MRSKKVPIGSFAFWLVWKLVTTLFLGVVPFLIFSGPELKGLMQFGFVLILLGIVAISNEELVYGHATQDGIYFRRYFITQFLPWDAISSVTWSASDRLQIRLKKGFLFRRELSAQSFGSKSVSDWLSEPPEVVRWLLVAKPSGAEDIELLGPGI